METTPPTPPAVDISALSNAERIAKLSAFVEDAKRRGVKVVSQTFIYYIVFEVSAPAHDERTPSGAVRHIPGAVHRDCVQITTENPLRSIDDIRSISDKLREQFATKSSARGAVMVGVQPTVLIVNFIPLDRQVLTVENLEAEIETLMKDGDTAAAMNENSPS